MKYAQALAASTLLPEAFRGHPANALVAIEYGNALGMAPMVALSQINVIKGTPSLSAAMMAALARQAGHKVRTSGDHETATCRITRLDDPDYTHEATWTEQKARDAGLWGRGHWVKDPGTMLKWRAIAECVRFACPEVLGGLKYTPEEVSEFKGQAAIPSDTDIQDAEYEDTTVPAPVSDSTRGHLFALFAQKGVVERERQLYAITHYTGEVVGSRGNLTEAQARLVIAGLEHLADAPPATIDHVEGVSDVQE